VGGANRDANKEEKNINDNNQSSFEGIMNYIVRFSAINDVRRGDTIQHLEL